VIAYNSTTHLFEVSGSHTYSGDNIGGESEGSATITTDSARITADGDGDLCGEVDRSERVGQ